MSNMVVNTNVLALNAHRNMGVVGRDQATASARLSSGLRINSAADDAAGLSISENMRAQIRGLDQASSNSQDGISLVQTAEGGLQEINNMGQRLRELTVQAANDTNTAENRATIQLEVDQLLEEMTDMIGRVEFNGMNLLDSTADNVAGTDGVMQIQTGANSSQLTQLTLPQDLGSAIDALSRVLSGGAMIPEVEESGTEGEDDWIPGSPEIPASNGIAGADAATISAMLDSIDSFLVQVTNDRAQLGAVQNRLDTTIGSLDISSENLSAAESRIRDADMGREMMNLTQANVLQQAAMAMLSQANQAPQQILQLLR